LVVGLVLVQAGLGGTWLLALPACIIGLLIWRLAPARGGRGPGVSTSLISVVRQHGRLLSLLVGVVGLRSWASSTLTTFLPLLATRLGASPSNAAQVLTVFLVAGAIGGFAGGAVSDRIGRRPIYLTGGLFVALSAFPYFWLLDSGSTALVWTAMALAVIGGAVCMSSLQATLFTEMFGVGVRYSGMSFAYQLSAMVAGFVPAIATSLLVASGGASWPVAVLAAGLGVVSAVATLFLRETRTVDTSELEAGKAAEVRA
jgi:MFS family permease